MKRKQVMFIAGEASGDLLAAELVRQLREQLPKWSSRPTADYQPLEASLEPGFFGAGGSRMAEAGVTLELDMTAHSVIGLSDVLKNYFKFRRIFQRLYRLALERLPDAIVCVDFSGFNRRFAQAVKQHVRARPRWFTHWTPKVVQFVSPQVWASREGRVYQMARDYDLVLSIFPFEKAWYAARVPELPVQFVGHPMLDRYQGFPTERSVAVAGDGLLLLLPGSREAELCRHLPAMVGALALMRAERPSLRARMVVPTSALAQQAKTLGVPANLDIRIGNLPESLMECDVAIASTGTVTMECAYFGVPTVALYKTSWTTYQVGRRIVTVKHLAMPNLLANEEVYPEFVQDAATPENLCRAGLELLTNTSLREKVRARLHRIISELGGPGASRRAAEAISDLLRPRVDW